jgi:hypothetical protein
MPSFVNTSATTAVFLFLLSGSASADILTGPAINPANGHSYYLLTPETWTDSQAEAVSLGGNLVTINDPAENSWVSSTFSTFDGITRALWIGLTDAASEGTFIWASGEPVLYTNWAPGEPNNNGGVENWGEIFYPNDTAGRYPKWNDSPNAPNVINPAGTPTNGVVEVMTTVPEPNKSVLLLLGGLLLLGHSRFRRF